MPFDGCVVKANVPDARCTTMIRTCFKHNNTRHRPHLHLENASYGSQLCIEALLKISSSHSRAAKSHQDVHKCCPQCGLYARPSYNHQRSWSTGTAMNKSLPSKLWNAARLQQELHQRRCSIERHNWPTVILLCANGAYVLYNTYRVPQHACQASGRTFDMELGLQSLHLSNRDVNTGTM